MIYVTSFDPRTPSIARVYDYLLGGKDNFAADRAVAERLLAVYPPIIETVPESRRFVARAVTWVADRTSASSSTLAPGCRPPRTRMRPRRRSARRPQSPTSTTIRS